MATKPFFCEECSTRNTPDSKYCKECGASLHAAYQTLALTDHDRIDDPTDQERLTQFLDMAFWHSEAGNVDAAVRACKSALALNANSTTALSLLGTLSERRGDNAQAIAYFERVLALNPDSAADRIKLNQLQDGIHVAPVRASPVYRWLPPAFGTAGFSEFALAMRARWAALRRPEMPLLPARTTPALAAGVAAIFVITAGLFLIKPSPGVSAEPSATAQPAAKSAYGGASGPQNAVQAPALPPLVTLPARPGTPLAPAPAVIASVPPADPFVGQAPLPLPSGPGYGSAQGGMPPHARRSGAGRLHALPALVAVPAADQGPLPPAPVTVEPNAPMPADAGIARHTVVVHRLNGLSEFTPPDARPASDTGDSSADPQNVPSGPPSSIQITVDPGTGSNSPGGGVSDGGGESDQQSAFSLQQQGHYRQAAALYGRAIAAYQAQIASGQDVDAAQRGLQACQTGLQICRQSQ